VLDCANNSSSKIVHMSCMTGQDAKIDSCVSFGRLSANRVRTPVQHLQLQLRQPYDEE
jgi:hypothetical protein